MARISGKVDTSSGTVNSDISVTGPGHNLRVAGRGAMETFLIQLRLLFPIYLVHNAAV